MIATLTIEVHCGDTYAPDGTYAGYWRGRHWVAVPEPYQAGDTPTRMFAERLCAEHLVAREGHGFWL